jgi:hypothetical protein
MGRINTTLGGSTVKVSRLPAGSTVAANDLVVMNEKGFALPASAVLGVTLENNNTNGPTAIVANRSVNGGNYAATGSTMRPGVCELGNKNIAIVYCGDGTTATTGVRVLIKSPTGATVVPRVNVSAGAGIIEFQAVRLNSTQFVVAWTDGSVKFAILNNDGSIAVAATTVSASSSNSYWAMNVLTNSNIVFFYAKNATNFPTFSRYNASGVLQGSETTVQSVAETSFYSVGPCANGDFILTYHGGSNTIRRVRYSNTNSVVWAAATYATTNGNFIGTGGNRHNMILELPNGNVVLPGTTDGVPDVYVLDSSGAVIRTIDYPGSGAFIGGTPPAIAPFGSGGFAVIGQTATNPGYQYYAYDQNGLGVIGPVSFGPNGGTKAVTTQVGIIAIPIGNVGYVVYSLDYTSSPSYAINLMCIDSSGVLKGSAVVVRTAASSACGSAWAILSSDGIVVYAFSEPSGSAHFEGFYNVLRRSVYGVAVDAATSGQTLRVATEGTFTINQSFGAGGSFDSQSATIPGNKGVVSGTTAILAGVK